MDKRKHKGTPMKLRSGNWGVKIERKGNDETIQRDDLVTITTKSGDSWESVLFGLVFETSKFKVFECSRRPRTTPSRMIRKPRSPQWRPGYGEDYYSDHPTGSGQF